MQRVGVLPLHAEHRVLEQVEGLAEVALRTATRAMARRLLGGGLDDGVVEDELVAGLDEQAARRLSGSDADDALVELAHLQHHRREVGVAGDDDVRVDVVAGERQLQRVDDHRDVCPVLVVHAVRRQLHHRDVRGEQRLLEP